MSKDKGRGKGEGPHITSGWAATPYGDTYHFEHFPADMGDGMLAQASEGMWAVDAVMDVEGEGEPDTYHFNTYFARGLREALGIAVALALPNHFEEVVNIRPAEDEEIEAYFQARSHFTPEESPALTDEEAAHVTRNT